MQFTNTFTIPVDTDTAFAVLTDLERVAPCLPGARLDDVTGDTYSGHVKVKVGPIQVAYRGTARLVEADPEAGYVVITAAGAETRGSGTASAEVVATLEGVAAGTRVTVVTDLDVTGKPAQFGRGVMGEVGARIIQTFAVRLSERLQEAPGDAAAVQHAPQATGGDDALDLLDAGGRALIRRLGPVLVLLAALGYWRWRRSR